MASYGTDAEVQQLVWGAARSVVPASVTAARTTATAVINAKLGLAKDIATAKVPNQVNVICNLLSAGIIQEQRKPEAEAQNSKRGMALLEDYMSEGTEVLGEWGHTSFVDEFL